MSDLIGKENCMGCAVNMAHGEFIHLMLPSGKLIEVEVTGDTASVTVTQMTKTFNTVSDTYTLFNEELNDGKWETTWPRNLSEVLIAP